VQGIEIKTDDPILGARDVAGAEPKLPPPLRAQTWAQMNQRLLGAIQVEKSVMFFILTFIIIVAAFGIMSTLITVTVQKTREIGVMKALGAASGKSCVSSCCKGSSSAYSAWRSGFGLGLLTVHNINPINHFLSHVVGIELFPRDIYNFASIPAFLTVQDLLTIGGSALVICTLAGLLPALRAARLEPVEALRYE
jgi:lipoprotein-releasing system permease protein